MKKIFTLAFLFVTILSFPQVPQGVNYQAVVRDHSGNVVMNTSVGIRFRIHEGSSSGTIVYADSDAVTTNQFGLITAVIGSGNPSAFSTIQWGSGTYYNEVGLDITGGTNYQSMGNSQLISVPYALYANQANEHQTLSLSGNTLSISSGNSVTLPTGNANSGIFDQTLVIGNAAGINANTITQAFIGATQETGVNNFALAATWTVMPVVQDAVTGAYQSDQNNQVQGYPCNNSVLVYGATTHRGNTFYTMNTGCGGTKLLSFPTTFTSNVTYPSTSSGILFSDGSYLYLNNGDSTWLKLSVSGGTISIAGTLTLSGTSSLTTSVMYDGTYFFALNGATLTKYTVSNGTGAVVSSKSVYGSPSGLVNIDATRLYVLSGTTAPGSPNPIGEAVMTPIGKP